MKKVSVKKHCFFSRCWFVSLFFIVSNFLVWLNGAGYARPKTFEGLMQCYVDGLPFFGYSVVATLLFSRYFIRCLGGNWLPIQILRQPINFFHRRPGWLIHRSGYYRYYLRDREPI